MPRWAEGAAERLQRAAVELFQSHGFERTTAADIAAAAGLTERTFFRYFSDKRDVIFHGQEVYRASFVEGVLRAPAGSSTAGLLEAALVSASTLFPPERRDGAQLRQAIIDRYPALQERERHKGFELALLLAVALRGRGVSDPMAMLAAESAVTVFNVSFAQWLSGDDEPFDRVVLDVLSKLLSLRTSAPAPTFPTVRWPTSVQGTT